MNITRLSWQNLISNPLNTILCLLLMTLGVGIISLVLLLNNEVEQQLAKNVKGIDMVVGAKGSPLQLILSTVYHIDNPTGNISLKEVEKLKKNSMVKSTIPLSFGDTYNGFRIVGTTHDYAELYQTSLKEGRLWKEALEVVVGNSAAEINNLEVGDTFYGSHGLVEGGEIHDHFSYEVVGVLEESSSVIDKLILTNTESIWKVHNHDTHVCSDPDHHHEHDEQDDNAMITALLVKFKSPVGFIQLPRKVNETTNLQAAVPAFEINRLISLLGFGAQTIKMIAIIIMIVSGLSIFISLFNSLKKRRYELALMRVHGASRWQLVKLVLLEGILLSIFGTLFGIIISRLTLFTMSFFMDVSYSFSSIHFSLIEEELWLFPISLFIGFLASLIPTIQTYNINIPKTLSHE
jgi:putative ABC transport system permease protein